ncbi:hypothetical protein MesoLjLc_50530 [Mesorhizobium sp. L-8-10]|uniref:hypothetical protein n=1 Tax=Mesorhizobium sp. L-8-10 TaxID=2744523 RepID=UPI0019257D28|nr:hypothetical protein [Mesorhizobium sp. L-8-10]BCH33123.1 hypothetical protein MesoLjLc_50530 [Mesorhizobium sp. L-8-10]
MAIRRRTLAGDVALRNNLKKLGKIYDGKTLDIDIEHALEPLAKQTETNAVKLRDFVGKYPGFPQPQTPRKGGHLDEGVVSKRVYAKGNTVRTWWVSFRKRARKLAHLVEFGTAPHFQPNFRGGFSHPGARPRPFFRSAFRSKKDEVMDRFTRRAATRLSSVAIRMRSRTR